MKWCAFWLCSGLPKLSGFWRMLFTWWIDGMCFHTPSMYRCYLCTETLIRLLFLFYSDMRSIVWLWSTETTEIILIELEISTLYYVGPVCQYVCGSTQPPDTSSFNWQSELSIWVLFCFWVFYFMMGEIFIKD